MNKLNSLLIFATLSIGLIVISGVMPAADAANANLFVSAENSQFDNYMSGPQVIEVIVVDSDINDTDEAKGEPDVIINGKILRMVQGVDGNWYGYFADRNQAQIADSTAISENGIGLDYGDFCSNDDGNTILGLDLSETVGYAVSNTGEITGVIGSSFGGSIDNTCVYTSGTTANTMNVLREFKDVNPGNDEVSIGQIGLNSIDNWPFIQLYSLNPSGNVYVQYNIGAGVQTTVLTFDTVENFAGVELDRNAFPIDSQVHPTITDIWLNIDPTDEDSWTFGTYGTISSNYQVFDENGVAVGDTPENTDDNLLTGLLDELMCEDNCRLLINPNITDFPVTPLTIQDNDDTGIVGTDANDALSFQTIGGNLNGKIPVTLTENSANSGVFVMHDESDSSILKITDNAARGTAGTIDYNEAPLTILVVPAWGTIDIQLLDNEWNSGEEIAIIITDNDANKNSLTDEDLDFYNPDVDLIPSIQIGDPFTLESLSNAQLSNTALSIHQVQLFSQRALLESPLITIQNGDSLQLTTLDTFADLFNSINDPAGVFSGFNSFNFDVRSIEYSLVGGTINSISVDITDGQKIARIASTSPTQNLINLDDATGDDIFSMNPNSNVQIIFTFDVSGTPVISDGTVLPIAADFFSTGFNNDGLLLSERINNQIIRIEAEETGDNTGVFQGSLTFTMLNQLNSQKSTVYFNDDLLEYSDPITEEVQFPLIDRHLDEDGIRANYLDLGADGILTLISDRVEVATHSGTISFDSMNNPGDQVTVTLVDRDLDSNSDLIDIFTVVDSSTYPNDPARDSVGKVGLGVFADPSFGSFGRLFDVTFDDKRWGSGLLENGGTCDAVGLPADGLFAAQFFFVETTADSGIFLGDYVVPDTYCDSNDQIVSTLGTEMAINYLDFRDTSGAIIVVTYSENIVVPVATFCNDMTIDELISSGLYNVIDNRDGHLDGARITGTNDADLILASDAGNDIRAKKGNDCVIGGAGNDNLRGGSGNDMLFGLSGNDKLNGGSGDDALSCGDGVDKANGGKGTDTATADCETLKRIP